MVRRRRCLAVKAAAPARCNPFAHRRGWGRSGRSLDRFLRHGVADTGPGEPVTPDTVFRIGSITKAFTAKCERGRSALTRERLSALLPADSTPGSGP